MSQRDVEDLLAERGIGVTYETVRCWANKFGPAIATNIRKARGRADSVWHLDEMVVRILTLHHRLEAVYQHARRGRDRHAGHGTGRIGCDSATVPHKPKQLSDNGPSYIAGELAEYIEARKMSHVRGAPLQLRTQGKIERLHQTLKNRILLENYFPPGDLEAQIEASIEHYNHQRYHESLNSVTPAGAYCGRGTGHHQTA